MIWHASQNFDGAITREFLRIRQQLKVQYQDGYGCLQLLTAQYFAKTTTRARAKGQ